MYEGFLTGFFLMLPTVIYKSLYALHSISFQSNQIESVEIYMETKRSSVLIGSMYQTSGDLIPVVEITWNSL